MLNSSSLYFIIFVLLIFLGNIYFVFYIVTSLADFSRCHCHLEQNQLHVSHLDGNSHEHFVFALDNISAAD